MARLVYVVTHPLTAFRFLDGQLAFMRERGFDVTVIASPGEMLDSTARREGVRAVGIPMERGISPREDVPSLVGLLREFRRLRPDLVVASTPKAGLLGTMAARLARVPVVVYHLRGLRFETARGAARVLLLSTERISSRCADRVQCNGDSLRREFVLQGCAPLEKTWVPGRGTSNGVAAARFEATPARREWARAERTRRGIGEHEFVIGFVGRLARDKGIEELVRALRTLRSRAVGVRLLVLGESDATDPLPEGLEQELETSPDIVHLGHVREPEPYYAMMNVLAFPSHREGFPNAPLEAAAAGVPTVGFRATGTVDAVVDGVTGTLVATGDAEGLAAAFARYANSPDLLAAHGRAAQERVREHFDQPRLWAALANDYQALIDAGRERH